jgi:hypothetical protein
MKKKYYIKERDNPQLGTYFVRCGQMTKTEARQHERTKYGINFMHSFNTEVEYNAQLKFLQETGERIQ